MDRVVNGDYATGVEPLGVSWHPGDDPTRLVKIDQPQQADHAITRMLEQSDIGRIAAELVGADLIQCWAVQLLYKPAAGTPTGNVGWHQDDDYWAGWWEGEVFTCWVALSDVTAESGPMRFVPGSHQWGFLKSGNFWELDLDGGAQAFPVPGDADWREVPAILPPGGASFHHRRTIHGSGPNTSATPRRSYAVHLRTERADPVDAAPPDYMAQLDDQDLCPVLFRR
jgi:ectoine hydroxylase-related dioxygenase (phytanoyl-CoA dioxygenase family)